MAEALLQLPKADVPKLKLPQLDKSFKNLKYLPSSKEIERLATINKINAIEVMSVFIVREVERWRGLYIIVGQVMWRMDVTPTPYEQTHKVVYMHVVNWWWWWFDMYSLSLKRWRVFLILRDRKIIF